MDEEEEARYKEKRGVERERKGEGGRRCRAQSGGNGEGGLFWGWKSPSPIMSPPFSLVSIRVVASIIEK